MTPSTPEKEIQKIIARLTRLERAVFGKKEKRVPQKENFSGPTGGVRFLISRGFLKKKHALREVRAALGDHDYHYSKQAVHEALNRLSGKHGPLVALKEGSKKFYVERK